MSTRCQLCGVEKSIQQLNRNSGLAMCDTCHAGEIQPACHHLGLSYHVERSTREVRTQNTSSTYHYLDITARYPAHAVPFQGQFSRESSLGFVRKFLDTVGLGDPKVGDPLFDDYVEIKAAENGELMRILRAKPGLQDAIMELLAGDGEIMLAHDHLTIRIVQSETPPDDAPALRGVCALCAHIQSAA
jgi:hypothetical protein